MYRTLCNIARGQYCPLFKLFFKHNAPMALLVSIASCTLEITWATNDTKNITVAQITKLQDRRPGRLIARCIHSDTNISLIAVNLRVSEF